MWTRSAKMVIIQRQAIVKNVVLPYDKLSEELRKYISNAWNTQVVYQLRHRYVHNHLEVTVNFIFCLIALQFQDFSPSIHAAISTFSCLLVPQSDIGSVPPSRCSSRLLLYSWLPSAPTDLRSSLTQTIQRWPRAGAGRSVAPPLIITSAASLSLTMRGASLSGGGGTSRWFTIDITSIVFLYGMV